MSGGLYASGAYACAVAIARSRAERERHPFAVIRRPDGWYDVRRALEPDAGQLVALAFSDGRIAEQSDLFGAPADPAPTLDL